MAAEFSFYAGDNINHNKADLPALTIHSMFCKPSIVNSILTGYSKNLKLTSECLRNRHESGKYGFHLCLEYEIEYYNKEHFNSLAPLF